MPQKSWAVGEEVLATDFNTYLQNQCVPQFTGTTQRDSQWAAPPNGAVCVTTDTNTMWLRAAGVWITAAAQPVAYAQVTANQAGITTIVDLTGLSVTFTAAAGRRYRVSAQALVLSSATADLIVGYIRDGANTQVGRWCQLYQVGTAGTGLLAAGSVYLTPSAGSYTVKLSLERNAGTGTVTMQAGGGFPAFIAVDAV